MRDFSAWVRGLSRRGFLRSLEVAFLELIYGLPYVVLFAAGYFGVELLLRVLR